MAHHFVVVDENPNDVTGGGGDISAPMHDPDCHGPYVVYPGQDFEDVASPHAVVCAVCVKEMYEAVYGKDSEVLGGGEHSRKARARK